MMDEWEGIWKEAAVAYSRYYRGIFFKELRKFTENLHHESRCPGRYSN
jgi:hypothetical protein